MSFYLMSVAVSFIFIYLTAKFVETRHAHTHTHTNKQKGMTFPEAVLQYYVLTLKAVDREFLWCFVFCLVQQSYTVFNPRVVVESY